MDINLNSFIDDLASDKPAPGGGGASALVGILATCLGQMVGNLTVGKKKYVDVEEKVISSMEKLEQFKVELLNDIKYDEECFLPLSKAYSLPRNTEEEIAHKNKVMEEALVTACKSPLKIINDIKAVLEELEILEECGSRLAYSDVGVAVQFVSSAVSAASLNVYINTKFMKNEEVAKETNIKCEMMVKEIVNKCENIYSKVIETLKK